VLTSKNTNAELVSCLSTCEYRHDSLQAHVYTTLHPLLQHSGRGAEMTDMKMDHQNCKAWNCRTWKVS